ncbi:MAG: Stp1/IreP family PP2C-type Ser/Thr phosphatase [Eubacteriaceae bacterium]|nr:Stp1/IreP family PP2C-type Ser/Thr phosphatase [Eubacteriaceae bacterium]
MEIGYRSDIGKVRKVNQDSFLVMDDKDGITAFAVADGLGGHKGGEVASSMVIQELEKYFSKGEIIPGADYENIKESIIAKIKIINQLILQRGQNDGSLSGMGTTLTLCFLNDRLLQIFHVGDSRMYVYGNGVLDRITTDHSLVEQLIASGEITEEEAYDHPNKNILTRAIGTDKDIEIDYYVKNIRKNDIFLLCTDGLTNLVHEDEIRKIISENSCTKAVDLLVKTANENGGRDNITVISFKPEVN